MLGYTRIRPRRRRPPPARPQLPDLRPRKLPRQARSRATFDAILEACARLLREGDLAALTTNRIAERAGVSIGSLYEFFPGREAILAALTQRRLAALRGEVEAALEEALASRDDSAATDVLVRRIVAAVSADRALYRVLLREARFLRELPETRSALAAIFALGRLGGERASRRTALREPASDAWLLGRMLAHGVLEIAFLEKGDPSREALVRSLVRLAHRMIHGRDPARPRARA